MSRASPYSTNAMFEVKTLKKKTTSGLYGMRMAYWIGFTGWEVGFTTSKVII